MCNNRFYQHERTSMRNTMYQRVNRNGNLLRQIINKIIEKYHYSNMKSSLTLKVLIQIILIMGLLSCEKLFQYQVNDYTSDIGYFDKTPKRPYVKDTIEKLLSIPNDLDTSEHKWYYYYYGMKAHFVVKEVLYFKETQEIVGVDLSWGRIINYYNPKFGEKCYTIGPWGKDSLKVVRAIESVARRIDSIVVEFDEKFKDKRTYIEIDDSIFKTLGGR